MAVNLLGHALLSKAKAIIENMQSEYLIYIAVTGIRTPFPLEKSQVV